MSILRLPARMESLERFRSFVIGTMGPGLEGMTDRVDLVLEEVLVNIIHYAYSDGGDIEVECDAPTPERFHVTVKDWGSTFNPLDRKEPEPPRDISEMPVGGLGVHLVRHMTNGLRYERKDGANILSLSFEKEMD